MTKTTKTIIGIIVVIIIVGGIWYGVGRKQPVTEKEPIKIGAIVGLTGAGAFYSDDVRDGMLLAQKDLKEEGIDLKIIFEDSKTDAKEAVTAFNKLITLDNVDIVVSLFSVTSVPLVPLAEENKVPLMVSITSAKDIGKNPYVLQYYLRAEDYAYPIAEVVAEKGYTKVAFMHELDDFGQSVKDAFAEKFSELGGRIIMTEAYNIPETDFRTSITKIKNSDAEAIVFAGFKPHYVKVMKNIAELGLTLPFFEVSPNTMYPEVIEEVGAAAEGNIAVSLVFPVGESNLKFKQDFKERYGREPNVATSLGYDMIQIIGRTTKGQSMTGEELVNAIVGLKKFAGLNGEVEITKEGEFIFPTKVIIVEGGKIKELLAF